MRDFAKDIQAAVAQGELPATGMLRGMAKELGLTIELPEKYPTKEQKLAAWASIQAAQASETGTVAEDAPEGKEAPEAPVEQPADSPLKVRYRVVKSTRGQHEAEAHTCDTEAEAEEFILACPADLSVTVDYWIRKVWTNALL